MSLLNPTGVHGSMPQSLRSRCPNCGECAIFYRYLKVNPCCPACDHDLAQYPSDDGPAFFTILITGQVLIIPLLLFSIIWKAPLILNIPRTLIPLAVFTLMFLPRVKGSVIGLHYDLRISRDDARLHTAYRYD